jgi:hypothetical protein
MITRNAVPAAVLCLATAIAYGAPDAEVLIARFAREAPASIAFTETRFSPLLREPTIVSGELRYLEMRRLDRRVTSPYRETTTIDGGTVRVERDGERTRSFALGRAPELEGFLLAFVALLAGDSSTLEDTFTLATDGDADGAWTLELTPIDERLRRRVRSIAVFGSVAEPRCVATLDAKETGSVMLLGAEAATPVAPQSTLDDLLALCRGR